MLDFNRIKYFYMRGLWTKNQVADAVKVSVITPEEFEEIVGESFNPEEKSAV